ncbi:transporter substrate-binding domain-containing protein [Agromyces sp. Marseille-P2726]|uniref:transporter substrate-binding domain-containing protein n=1 Tax=Agromyces sp. Marseille-P2726 TaxID=2709132 RepID=UPI001570D6F3|nr:transporter substrate-binding domain-containing protein [Agromyces sp. Marseille-P2726]
MNGLRRVIPLVAVSSLLLSGCGIAIPADPHGTLDRVRGGELRVGVSHQPPWTETYDDREPSGDEVELVEQFAAALDADVEWAEGGESALVRALERGELDVVIGGIADDTPWAERAAATRAYAESIDDRGERTKHVMLVRMGENRFLVELERFLDREGRG